MLLEADDEGLEDGKGELHDGNKVRHAVGDQRPGQVILDEVDQLFVAAKHRPLQKREKQKGREGK